MPRLDLVRQLSIDPGQTLLQAIEKLTKAEHKILLVVDNDGKLAGVLTDYDIRRAFLHKHGLESRIGDIIEHKPVVAQVGASEREIVGLIERTSCHQIPILDSTGRPVDVRFYAEFAHILAPDAERSAVVLAGGFGTRLRPLTETTPKPMLAVGGRPLLFILLDQLISEGFKSIYLALHYKSEMIIERVRETPRYRNVRFIIEEEPLGTAGALSRLPIRPIDPFLVINADLLTEVPLLEMLRFHEREGNVATIAVKRESFEVPYGVVETENGRVLALREKPEIRMDVNMGVYMLSPETLDLIEAGVRIDMPDLIGRVLANKARVGGFPVHEFWLDVGTKEQYAKAQLNVRDHARLAER